MTLKSKGIFTFKFTAFGGMSLGSMNAYIEKAGNSLNVMFDVDSIKKIISIVATLSGSKTVSAADKILQQYDGVCAGFKMKRPAMPRQPRTPENLPARLPPRARET